MRGFWVVLGDNSSQTTYRHDTFESAKTEAKRLVLSNKGVRFWVLRAVGSAELPDPVRWSEADDNEIDELPF